MTAAQPAQAVALGRRALHQLKTVLERETGSQAAMLLREVGFAGGESCYLGFCQWVQERYGVESPQQIDARFLGEALTGFFRAGGWGALTLERLGPGTLALDALEWAEAEPRGAEYPSCHVSCGLLAEFFTRLGSGPVAVMEVECRCRGDARCRFLLGSPDILTWVYDRMVAGTGYVEALGDLNRK